MKSYEGLIGCPATDVNFPSGIGRLNDGELQEFYDRLVELEAAEGGHKGRIKAVEKEMKARSGVSKEVLAVALVAEEVKRARELYGDGQPFDEERVLDCLVFRAERSAHELYEFGRYCLWLKAEVGHGRFMEGLQNKEINVRFAQWAMLMVQKFGDKYDTVSHLGARKARLLTTFTKEEIDEYAKGGDLAGIPHDSVESKTYSELAKEVRENRKKIASQKERYEKTIKGMSEELADLRMRYANQEPPTKEQTALAALFELALPYTYALTDIKTGIRKAYALARQAETIPGADVQMLSEWFGQFSDEMRTFAELTQTWTDEVDMAHPIANVGAVAEAGSPDAGRGLFAAGRDVPELG
jgi:hypothetical protein